MKNAEEAAPEVRLFLRVFRVFRVPKQSSLRALSFDHRIFPRRQPSRPKHKGNA